MDRFQITSDHIPSEPRKGRIPLAAERPAPVTKRTGLLERRMRARSWREEEVLDRRDRRRWEFCSWVSHGGSLVGDEDSFFVRRFLLCALLSLSLSSLSMLLLLLLLFIAGSDDICCDEKADRMLDEEEDRSGAEKEDDGRSRDLMDEISS